MREILALLQPIQNSVSKNDDTANEPHHPRHALASINTQPRRSYPIRVEHMIRTQEEKASTQAKKQARKAKSEGPKRKPGRPKGSRNKDKTQVELNPELQWIQKMLQSFLSDIEGKLHLTYLVLDGHFGNQPTLQIVRQCKLHLISKLRHDAALYFPNAGPKPKRGPTARLGEKLDIVTIIVVVFMNRKTNYTDELDDFDLT